VHQRSVVCKIKMPCISYRVVCNQSVYFCSWWSPGGAWVLRCYLMSVGPKRWVNFKLQTSVSLGSSSFLGMSTLACPGKEFSFLPSSECRASCEEQELQSCSQPAVCNHWVLAAHQHGRIQAQPPGRWYSANRASIATSTGEGLVVPICSLGMVVLI
jgi:hypothetical protein